MKCTNCNYYWQDKNDDHPRCHFEEGWDAPCEEKENYWWGYDN